MTAYISRVRATITWSATSFARTTLEMAVATKSLQHPNHTTGEAFAAQSVHRPLLQAVGPTGNYTEVGAPTAEAVHSAEGTDTIRSIRTERIENKCFFFRCLFPFRKAQCQSDKYKASRLCSLRTYSPVCSRQSFLCFCFLFFSFYFFLIVLVTNELAI